MKNSVFLKAVFTEFFLYFSLQVDVIYAQQQALETFMSEGRTLNVYPSDHASMVLWGPSNSESGARSGSDGKGNTQSAVNKYKDWNQGNYAASICSKLNGYGFSDWYLPSITELKDMYRYFNRSGSFAPRPYWSSTELKYGAQALSVDFSGGFTLTNDKSDLLRIRCVREAEVPRSSGNDQMAGIWIERSMGYISMINLQKPDIWYESA